MRIIFLFIALCVLAESPAKLINRPRPKPGATTCGVQKVMRERMIRGKSFDRGTFPWIVALFHKGFDPPRFFCGGTVISKSFVISAAHCILNKGKVKPFMPWDVLVLFGAHDFSHPLEAGRYQLSPTNIFIHDEWKTDTSNYDADLSLLEFEDGSISYNQFVQPVCLWPSQAELPTINEGIVTGWGRSHDRSKAHENIPTKIEPPIQNNEECFLKTPGLLTMSSLRTFCAGLKSDSGVCTGDSGGGFFIEINGVFYLRGTVSSSMLVGMECDVSKNAIYANVFKFRKWIEETIGNPTEITTFRPGTIPTPRGIRVITPRPTTHRPFQIDLPCSMRQNGKKCKITQKIDSENYVISSGYDGAVEQFDINDNRNVKFIPRGVGENFPNLIQFWAKACDLTVIRNYYLEGLRNVQKVYLHNSKISSIEARAFVDLVSVDLLHLNNNLLETLDAGLFSTMTSLKHLFINANRISSLSPTTFSIPGGNLKHVYSGGNKCLQRGYPAHLFDTLMVQHIRQKC